MGEVSPVMAPGCQPPSGCLETRKQMSSLKDKLGRKRELAQCLAVEWRKILHIIQSQQWKSRVKIKLGSRRGAKGTEEVEKATEFG